MKNIDMLDEVVKIRHKYSEGKLFECKIPLHNSIPVRIQNNNELYSFINELLIESKIYKEYEKINVTVDEDKIIFSLDGNEFLMESKEIDREIVRAFENKLFNRYNIEYSTELLSEAKKDDKLFNDGHFNVEFNTYKDYFNINNMKESFALIKNELIKSDKGNINKFLLSMKYAIDVAYIKNRYNGIVTFFNNIEKEFDIKELKKNSKDVIVVPSINDIPTKVTAKIADKTYIVRNKMYRVNGKTNTFEVVNVTSILKAFTALKALIREKNRIPRELTNKEENVEIEKMNKVVIDFLTCIIIVFLFSFAFSDFIDSEDIKTEENVNNKS